MQFDLERVIKDIEDIKKDLAKNKNKSKTIIKQHNRIFKMLRNKKGSQSPRQYGY
jgi:hypothetical protein